MEDFTKALERCREERRREVEVTEKGRKESTYASAFIICTFATGSLSLVPLLNQAMLLNKPFLFFQIPHSSLLQVHSLCFSLSLIFPTQFPVTFANKRVSSSPLQLGAYHLSVIGGTVALGPSFEQRRETNLALNFVPPFSQPLVSTGESMV